MPAPMPQRLGRYAVRRRLGSGGFATVWLAYDDQLDSPVAVKVLADNWTEDAHVRRRFAEEGRYLRKVESPHVVSVYDAGELEDGRPYLVMSYADQGTLADRLETGGFSAAEALEVVRQVGSGLQALHDRDILHRDVKPANVLFRSVSTGGTGQPGEVRAMLGDLGFGKALDISSRLTMVAGTPSYVAPEQARAEPLDARADQYSLAALTFLLLSGRSPFRHADLGAAADPAEPTPLSAPERAFGPAVEAVVRRGLARDRDDRYPSVSVFVAALEHALSVREPSGDTATGPWLALDPDLTQPGARPSTPSRPAEEQETQPAVDPAADPAVAPAVPRPRRGRRAALVAAGVVALVVGGGAGWVVRHAAGDEVVVGDADSVVSATVPRDWTAAGGRAGWSPPGADGDVLPAFSTGTTRGWTTGAGAQGAFLGLLPGTRLPTVLPQHPECDGASGPVVAETRQGSAVTVVHRSCPGGAVTVERVVQVTDNRLLWVQVRSADLATANRVLDSVSTSGLR